MSCKNTRRSVGLYIFKLAGGFVSWASKQQPTVIDNTTEAEYKALSEATKEGVYIRRLLNELKVFTFTQGSQLLPRRTGASWPRFCVYTNFGRPALVMW